MSECKYPFVYTDTDTVSYYQGGFTKTMTDEMIKEFYKTRNFSDKCVAQMFPPLFIDGYGFELK